MLNVKTGSGKLLQSSIVTLVLDLGANGLRTGFLFGFPAGPLVGADFLLDVMLSRMFVTRGWTDGDVSFPEAETWTDGTWGRSSDTQESNTNRSEHCSPQLQTIEQVVHMKHLLELRATHHSFTTVVLSWSDGWININLYIELYSVLYNDKSTVYSY